MNKLQEIVPEVSVMKDSCENKYRAVSEGDWPWS